MYAAAHPTAIPMVRPMEAGDLMLSTTGWAVEGTNFMFIMDGGDSLSLTKGWAVEGRNEMLYITDK